MLALVLHSSRDFCFYQHQLFLEPSAQNKEIACPLYNEFTWWSRDSERSLFPPGHLWNKFLLSSTLLVQALHIHFLFLGYSFFSRFHTILISVCTCLAELFTLHYLSAGNYK